jgi:peptidoglycan LD-endopeptidase LytH
MCILRRRNLACGLAIIALTGRADAQMKASGSAATVIPDSAVVELRRKDLLFPIAGQTAGHLKDTFNQPRPGQRKHNALDIPAPRGAAVLSVDSGQVIKVYSSEAGGLMIYAADPSERFIYNYAHLDRYQKGIREGSLLARGDTIGFVGTTGNAPCDTPHLHFAIHRSQDIKRWSKGRPVNPYKVFELDN